MIMPKLALLIVEIAWFEWCWNIWWDLWLDKVLYMRELHQSHIHHKYKYLISFHPPNIPNTSHHHIHNNSNHYITDHLFMMIVYLHHSLLEELFLFPPNLPTSYASFDVDAMHGNLLLDLWLDMLQDMRVL